MKHYVLKNGIPVLFHKMPNTHSVTLGLYIRAGAGYSTECIDGISHFLEHLHFRRAGEFSQEQLYYKMESMGSTLRASTYRDFMKFTMKITPQAFEECIEIFCNLIDAYEWTDKDFSQEKQVVVNQILEKGTYVSIDTAVRETIFRKHPLSDEIMGSVDSVESITITDIQKYKKSVFYSGNLLFCVTGNIDALRFRKGMKTLQMITIPQGEQKNILEYPKVFHHRKPDIVFVPVQGEELMDVNLSFDVAYDKVNRDALLLLNCILGEGVGSRLQKSVREEKGYTSNISSYVEWYQKFAVLHICFSVDRKLLLPCMEEIVKILQEMKYSIESRDLEISLPFYTANHVFYEDDTEEMNFQLAYHTFVQETDFAALKMENSADTIAFLEKSADELFVKNNMCVVIVGNAKKITKKSIIGVLYSLETLK